jgi:hypothetical protein
VSKLQEKMLVVRGEQQEEARKKSQEAKKERELKKAKRFKDSAISKASNGQRLGSTSEDDSKIKSLSRPSYNPLLPSSGSAGPSYR